MPLNLQHWRGLAAIIGLKASPVLDFVFFDSWLGRRRGLAVLADRREELRAELDGFLGADAFDREEGVVRRGLARCELGKRLVVEDDVGRDGLVVGELAAEETVKLVGNHGRVVVVTIDEIVAGASHQEIFSAAAENDVIAVATRDRVSAQSAFQPLARRDE